MSEGNCPPPTHPYPGSVPVSNAFQLFQARTAIARHLATLTAIDLELASRIEFGKDVSEPELEMIGNIRGQLVGAIGIMAQYVGLRDLYSS